MSAEESDISEGKAEEGSLADIDAAGKNFEDLYARCGDVSFAPVYFGFDSTVVPQGELGKIDAVASHLADNANRVVVVEGHCDERGSNEYNMSLGENRAIIIRNYLVQNGIGADRIQTRSYGEEKPAVVGGDESAWSKNRRGEFAIFQK
ncbi:MAG: OmpA family protein [Kiritimatiellae bacterium]|nr:OmpA family protein [Kiritimatiellia bacterium]